MGFMNENVWIDISLKNGPEGPIDTSLILVQILAWCRSGELLPESMVAYLTDAYKLISASVS